MSTLDDALQTFIVEASELLEQMEGALLHIEQAGADPDTINAIFRAAHTIKGSAGLFGLDHIVSFTHVAESVLDRVRDGELAMAPELVAVFLGVCDQLTALVALLAARSEPSAEVLQTSETLVAQLQNYLTPAPGHAITPPQEPTVVSIEGRDGAGTDHWHLSLRFGPDVLRNGMDPLAFVRYLTTFGEIVHIVTLVEAVPPLTEIDPETCHLGFEIAFRTDADKATIEGAFEFVRDDSRIRILPPNSKVSEFLRLIEDMPGEDMRLGDILVRCGTLTQAELDSALQQQQVHAPTVAQRPIGEMLVDQKLVQPSVVEAALEKQKTVKEHRSAEASLIRVDANKLDHLINLLGELIIASAGATQAAQTAGAPELVESATMVTRLVEEVRDSALTLRMVQIGGTFNRFQRVVRDVSAELGKDIRLEISGAETELDKTVVEKIGDPLTHLVRNAMDHGIESAELRAANGKPAQGTVRLNAYHDAGSIVIEVSDDGGGLRKERIVAKAIERGLIESDAGMSERDIYNLIFEPGFSTAAQVSNLSGRGVGMDVVKRNITALRGTVSLSSVEGQGTTVHIRLPLTLAIIDGFLIGVGQAAYVVPLEMVVECIELTRDQSEATHGRNYLNLRGEVLPFVRLRQLFSIQDAPVRRENVVVIQYGGRRAGLVVDRLMGEFQTVIKPLGKVFSHVPGVGGFTILGSGAVALILDVPSLVSQVVHDDAQRSTLALAA